MRGSIGSSVLVFLCIVMNPVCGNAADLPDQLQNIVDAYVANRHDVEKISGVALHVDFKDHDAVDVFAGTYGGQNARPIGRNTLFEVGSNTKHFTSALILKLEAQGLLRIDQTVGEWLPQYPAWANVTIRSLLNMTSEVPNYSETVPLAKTLATDMSHQFSMSDLVAAVYDQGLPVPTGWFYSNTNTVLAGMIIEAATHMSYKDALETMLLKPLHLKDTFYNDGPYPPRVQRRLPSGIYDNRDCTLYQPQPCAVTAWQPLVGQDVSRMNMSWAGPAGAIVSTPHDLAIWVRDLFGLRVIPQAQLDEMTAIVSMKTGQPVADVSADDPHGFGLGLGRNYQVAVNGAFWFYEGITFGFRTIFAYWPQYDLVITASTNSQPADGEDHLAAEVIVKAFDRLHEDGLIASP